MLIRPATTRTSTSSRRTGALLAAALALAAGAAACGGKDEEATQKCVDEARNSAEASVVANYYAAGRLGPKAQIRRVLNVDGRQYFEDGGRMMRPYDELTPQEQSFLVLWFTNDGRIDQITHDDRQKALEAADTSDC